MLKPACFDWLGLVVRSRLALWAFAVVRALGSFSFDGGFNQAGLGAKFESKLGAGVKTRHLL